MEMDSSGLRNCGRLDVEYCYPFTRQFIEGGIAEGPGNSSLQLVVMEDYSVPVVHIPTLPTIFFWNDGYVALSSCGQYPDMVPE